MKNKNTKGGAPGTMIALSVAVGAAVFALIFIGVMTGETYKKGAVMLDAIGNTSYSETVTVYNDTWVHLTHIDIHNESITVFNGTNSLGGQGNNWTVDIENYQIELLPGKAGIYNNTAVTVTYNHGAVDVKHEAYRGITSSFSAMEQTGEYLPIIVMAVILMIVLALVLTTIGGKIDGGNGGSL